MNDSNINDYFFQSSIQYCGHVDLSIKTLKEMIYNKRDDYKANQRVLLTTIYRFSINCPFLLWKIIQNNPDISIDKFSKQFPFMNKNELATHSKFVLQKHGIRQLNNQDPLKTLYEYFFINDRDNRFFKNNIKYPSIITSLTQPVGSDPVEVWMKYNGNMSVRRYKGTVDIDKRISSDLLHIYNTNLC